MHLFPRHPATTALRILVVDDERGMRSLARTILERAGHEVFEATNGAEAISLAEQGLSFDLVVADLDMPVMGGAEMVRRLRQLRDEFKVLFVTAYIDRLMDTRPLSADEAFLDKPYTKRGLTEAVSLLAFGTIAG